MRSSKERTGQQATKATKPAVLLPAAHSKDLVWAKVPTWPWWPARVLERRTVTKEDGSKHEINIVLFFVDNTIGEVSGALLPFHEHYHRFKDFDYNNKKLMHAIEEARAVLLDAKLNESPSSIRPALPPVKGQKLNTRQQQQAQQQQQQQAAAITARHPPGEEVVLPAAESPGGAGGPVLPYPLPIKEDCSKGSRQLLRWLRQAALEPEVPRNKLTDQTCKRMLHAIRHNQQAVEGVELLRISSALSSSTAREAWPPAAGVASPSSAPARANAAAAANGEQVRCSKRLRKPQPWLAAVAEEMHLPSLLQPPAGAAQGQPRAPSNGRTAPQRQTAGLAGLQARYARMPLTERDSRATSSGSSKQAQQHKAARRSDGAANARDSTTQQSPQSWEKSLQRRRPACAREHEEDEVLLIEQGPSLAGGRPHHGPLTGTKRVRARAICGATSSGDARESNTALEDEDDCGYSLGEEEDEDDVVVGGSPPSAERLLQRCSSLLALTLPMGGAGCTSMLQTDDEEEDDEQEGEEDGLAGAGDHEQHLMMFDDMCGSGASDDEEVEERRRRACSMSEDEGPGPSCANGDCEAAERPGVYAGLHGLLDEECIATDMAHAADMFGALALGGDGVLLGSPAKARRLAEQAYARGGKCTPRAAAAAALAAATASQQLGSNAAPVCLDRVASEAGSKLPSDVDTDGDVGVATGPSGDMLEGEDSDSPTTTVAGLEMLIDGWQPDVEKAGPTDPDLEAEMQRAAASGDGRLRLRSCSGSDSASHLIKIAEICGRDTDIDGFGTDDSELKDDGGNAISTHAAADGACKQLHRGGAGESAAVLALRAALDTARHELQGARSQLASSREEAARQRQLREERDKVLGSVVGELRGMRSQLRALQKAAAKAPAQQQQQQQVVQLQASAALQAAMDALAPAGLAGQQQQQASPSGNPTNATPPPAAAVAAVQVTPSSINDVGALQRLLAEAQSALVEAHQRQTLLIQRQQHEVQQLRIWLQTADAEAGAIRRDNEQLRRTFLDGRASGVHIASTVLTALMASPKLSAKEKERLSAEMNSLLVQLVGKAA